MERLPQQLGTLLGSGQQKLTPAQAQQIALARLVVADPHTLVLDEATSLIDPRTARHLEGSMAALLQDRTVIAIAHRLPSMFGWGEYCDAGGLLSYGANQRATYFWLATYADRILRGEKPANLPVFQPTKFELVVNLRTAERLGIDLDKSSILFRANRVIE